MNERLHTCTCRYNGRPLSGARVTTCWLDRKNMIELGITEDMVYGDLATSKGDSYGRGGGNKTWKGRYQGGGGRRFAPRDRGETSSSFRYDREPSRSPSPSPNYKTQASSHLETVSSLAQSVGISSSPIVPNKTEQSESQERPSSSRYSLRSGDSQERPSSQASDYSSQSGVREESVERSLSQASHGSRDSASDRKRQPSSTETRSSSRLRARKRHESESDDTSSKERDSNRKPRQVSKNDSKKGSNRYSRRSDEHRSKRTTGRLADRSSESDSKERDRDREEKEKREQWKRYHRSRRSRESPRRRRPREQSDDEKQPKSYDNSESDGQMAALTVTKSPKPLQQESISSQPLPVQPQANIESNIQVAIENPLDEVTNQIQPMDLDTSQNSSPEPEDNIQPSKPPTTCTIKKESQLESQINVELGADQAESQIDTQLVSQLDTLLIEPQTQSMSMPSTPPPNVFDFERDETPPAEIVEATAEWCRTQNIPANFNSIPLQHVFQYYQSSMAASGTKKDDGLQHNPAWPASSFQQQGDQLQEQTACAASASPSKPTPNLSENIAQSLNLTTEQLSSSSQFQLCPESSTTMAENLADTGDTSFPTIQLGPSSHPAAESRRSSRLVDANSRDFHKLSDNEVKQQLEMFLNKSGPRAQEYSSSSESVLGSQLPARGETTSFSTNVMESSRSGPEQMSDIERWSEQKSKEPSPYHDLRSRTSSYHDRSEEEDRTRYNTPQNRDRSYLRRENSRHMDHLPHSSYRSCVDYYHARKRDQRSSQPPSNRSYSLGGQFSGRSRANDLSFPHDHPPSTLHHPATFDTLEASMFFEHRSEPRELYEREPAQIRGQWREHERIGELSRDGTWRVEEKWRREPDVPLRRERTDDLVEWMERSPSNRFQEPNPSWRDDTRRLNRDDIMTPLTVTELGFPSQPHSTTPLCSVYRPSSPTTSETNEELRNLSYNRALHEEEFQRSQLRHSNQPLSREHQFQRYTSIRDEHDSYKGPIRHHHHGDNDITTSPLSSYQRRDVDRTSPTFYNERPLPLSTARERQESMSVTMSGNKQGRFKTTLDMMDVCTPSVEIFHTKRDSNFGITNPKEYFDHPESELEHHHPLAKMSNEDCNVRARAESFRSFCESVATQLPAPRNQSEQDQLQKILDKELAERALEEENAKQMIDKTSKEKVLKDKAACAYTALGKELTQNTVTELNHETKSADKSITEAIILTSAAEENNQQEGEKDLQTTPTKKVARKYKHLQKSYYKVNTCHYSTTAIVFQPLKFFAHVHVGIL